MTSQPSELIRAVLIALAFAAVLGVQSPTASLAPTTGRSLASSAVAASPTTASRCWRITVDDQGTILFDDRGFPRQVTWEACEDTAEGPACQSGRCVSQMDGPSGQRDTASMNDR